MHIFTTKYIFLLDFTHFYNYNKPCQICLILMNKRGDHYG